MAEAKLSDETNIPLKWVFALLVVGAAGMFTANQVGNYFGSRDAWAQAAEKRMDGMERALEALPKIDKRLAVIESSKGIKAPLEDRFSMGEGRDSK